MAIRRNRQRGGVSYVLNALRRQILWQKQLREVTEEEEGSAQRLTATDLVARPRTGPLGGDPGVLNALRRQILWQPSLRDPTMRRRAGAQRLTATDLVAKVLRDKELSHAE